MDKIKIDKDFVIWLRKQTEKIGTDEKFYSDTTEDKVLKIMTDILGIRKGTILDIGAGEVKGSNSQYLIKKGFKAWRIDRHKRMKDVIHAHVEKDTIKKLLDDHRCPKRVNILCLDIDNMDWWILRALLQSGYKFDLAVIEFNPAFNHTQTYTKPYIYKARKTGNSFYGASIRAFYELFNKYKYSIFYTASNNAFFIKNKHLSERGTIDLSEFHPKIWVEPWKRKANKKKIISKKHNKVKRKGISIKHLHKMFTPLSEIEL